MQWRGSGGGSVAQRIACPIVLPLIGWRRERIVVMVVVRVITVTGYDGVR